MRDRIVAIGKFDALHRGHHALIERAASLGAPGLLSFVGIAEVLGWPQRLPLCGEIERGAVLHRWSTTLGQDISDRRIPFAQVRELDPTAFLALLADEYGVVGLVTGTDFCFGRDRAGDVATLRRFCAERGLVHATVEPVLDATGTVISSSGVRAALAQGDLERVEAWLDRPYRLYGIVERGDGRGSQLGFPTANLGSLANEAPGVGVYAAWAELADGSRHAAAVNVGHQPTIGEDRGLQVEPHLLDFTGDCHGQRLCLRFVRQLRSEQRFPSVDALRAQIAADVATVRAELLPFG